MIIDLFEQVKFIRHVRYEIKMDKKNKIFRDGVLSTSRGLKKQIVNKYRRLQFNKKPEFTIERILKHWEDWYEHYVDDCLAPIYIPIRWVDFGLLLLE